MVDIVFVTDYVCPYCYVAKVALQKALEDTGIEARISMQPYELTMEPAPRVDTYHDPVRREHYQILVEPCRQMGIDMKLPPNVIPRPYTHLAFEGWLYALEHGKGEEYNDAMYRAYFVDEKDIGDVRVICKVAAKVGLDPYTVRKVLVDGVYSDYEREMVMYAKRKLKPRGIPTLYMNGEKLMLSTYTVSEMAELLKAHDDGRKLEEVLADESSNVDENCMVLSVGGHIVDRGDLMSADLKPVYVKKKAEDEAEADDAEDAAVGGKSGAGDAKDTEDVTSFVGCGPEGCGPGPENADDDMDAAGFVGCGPDGCGPVPEDAADVAGFVGCGPEGC